jgi:arylsulfatase A-like enzyme
MRRVFAVLAALWGFAPLANLLAADDASRPNIVFILADDFGVGDIHALYPNNKIATPNLDRLVAEGMHFTDAHSASAVCTPTRYGLLTGRYPWRTRLQEWVLACYEPPLIAAERLTLPAYLKQRGYRTACIGKWHLGWEWPGAQPSRMFEERNAQRHLSWDFSQPIRGGPTERGFDEYFGVDLPNFPPLTFIENDRVTMRPTERYQHNARKGYILPAAFNDAPMAPGWRFDAILPTITQRAVAHIRERAKGGQPFFLYFSLTSPHAPVTPSKRFAGKSGIAPVADFIMETDWSVGEVVRAIEEAGIAEDTLLVFSADNGHAGTGGWQQLVSSGHKPSGQYRGMKGEIWEGGHRVPFVVRWPKRVAPGSASNQLLCLNDMFATCAELLGDSLPADAAEDSFSFLSAALGKAQATNRGSGRTNLVSHSVNGEFAYREGDWKIVFKSPGPNLEKSRGKPAVVKLYHLADDIAETTDLARKHPKFVEQLTKGLQAVVDRGRSRPGPAKSNDARVRFEVIQTERWAPALH